ncbi:hypothetical protein A5727_18160 [Mycobacterium sp. ACS4331]|nr:hypothetical protein A5727_18160 [Mycobacterium sp. ACS4331]
MYPLEFFLSCPGRTPTAAALGVTAALSPTARAARMAVLLGRVIKASDIRASGATGAMRCAADRRPGGQRMLGRQSHTSIDDEPSCERHKQQVATFLRGLRSWAGHQRTGVCADSRTIDWAIQDGVGGDFPAAQLRGRRAASPTWRPTCTGCRSAARSVGGGGVDINHGLKPWFGQRDRPESTLTLLISKICQQTSFRILPGAVASGEPSRCLGARHAGLWKPVNSQVTIR